MIRPTRPCKRECPGWKVVHVGAFKVVHRCRECWADSVLKPSFRYYQSQPACLEALRAATVNNQ